MKIKYLFFVIIILIIYTPEYIFPDITVGLKGGLNITDFVGKDFVVKGDVGPKLGYNFGLVVDYYLIEFLAMEIGILYSTRGDTWKSTSGSSVTYNVDYIDCQVLFGVFIPVLKDFNFVPLLGVSEALNIGSKYEGEGLSGDIEGYNQYDVEFVDLGIVAGAGIRYYLDKAVIIFDVSYIWGLFSVLDAEEHNYGFNTTDIFNRQLSISLGFGFSIISSQDRYKAIDEPWSQPVSLK